MLVKNTRHTDTLNETKIAILTAINNYEGETMAEPIVPIDRIISVAHESAKAALRDKKTGACPYPYYTDAAARWRQEYMAKIANLCKSANCTA